MIKNTLAHVMVLEADRIAKGLYQENPGIINELRGAFGGKVVGRYNKVVFSRLSEIVFSSRTELLKLNRIMFPRLRQEIKRLLLVHGSYRYIIIDAAVLFGAKLDIICDYIILVESDEKTRKKFLKNKKMSHNEIELKMKGQHIKINKNCVDFTIINDGDKRELLAQTKSIIKEIVNREKAKHATEQV